MRIGSMLLKVDDLSVSRIREATSAFRLSKLGYDYQSFVSSQLTVVSAGPIERFFALNDDKVDVTSL